MLNPLKIFSEKDENQKTMMTRASQQERKTLLHDLGSNQREDTLGNDSSIVTLNRSDGETPHHQMPLSEDLLPLTQP